VQVKNQEQSNKFEIYQATISLLEPGVKKMKELMQFCTNTISKFAHHFNTLVTSEKKKDPISEPLMDILIVLLDNIVIVDSLKNIKSSLMNDFTAYRRRACFK
jgi:cytoplasmic FMR1 interacting protein